MIQWCKKKKALAITIAWLIAVVITSCILIYDNAKQIDYQTLKNLLQEKTIKEILVDKKYIYLYELQDEVYKIPSQFAISCTTKEDQLKECNLNLALKNSSSPIITSKTPISTKILYAVIICLIGLFIIFVINETGESESTLKTNDAILDNDMQTMSLGIEPIQSHVKFKDVAGIKEAKEDLLEIIDYLKNPKKYQDLGIYLPKGVLLVGPPGVGKTMIAKAIAGESGVPFFYQSGSSFVQIYVGVGAQRVRELFAKARANAPSIIFIDEIDAVGKARGADNHQEWETTLNELLTEMDGFSGQSGVIVVGATNQVDVIDQALLRSGRFDRRIYVDLPDLHEREEIFKVHLKNRPYNLNLNEVAKLCIGFSGANIASLINEAAINALRNKRKEIIMQDILDTTDRVMFGKRRQNTLSVQEKQSLAYYNAGKCISQYWLLNDFQKITLMDMNQESNIEQKKQEYNSKGDLISQIKIALSGNLSLEVNGFGASSIAKNDLDKAKDIAKKMCEEYGMGDKILADYEDILDILENAKIEHKEFILSNKDYIKIIANKLIEQEKVTKDDIQKILNNV